MWRSVLHSRTVVLFFRMHLLLFKALQKNRNSWDYCRTACFPKRLSTALKIGACKNCWQSTHRSPLQSEPLNQFTFFPSNPVHDKSLKKKKSLKANNYTELEELALLEALRRIYRVFKHVTMCLSRGTYLWQYGAFADKNRSVIQTLKEKEKLHSSSLMPYFGHLHLKFAFLWIYFSPSSDLYFKFYCSLTVKPFSIYFFVFFQFNFT